MKIVFYTLLGLLTATTVFAQSFSMPDQRRKTPVTNIGTLNKPLSVSNGGTRCGVPTTYAQRDTTPVQGEICGFTDSSVGCVAGTPVTAGGGSTFCLAVWDGAHWQPGGGVTTAAAGGFSTAGTGLTSSGATVSLLTPVTATLGGTGADLHSATGIVRAGNPFTSTTVTTTDTDNTIAKTGVDINTSNQVTATHLASALPYTQGGTGCKATTFATLPVTPPQGTVCAITDANTCSIGATISSGGGSSFPSCTVKYLNTSWIVADVAATNPLLVGVPVTTVSGIKSPSYTSNSANPATTGLINDINNNRTIAARDVQNDGNDIQEIATDTQNLVHIGGGGATGISLDNASIESQGAFSSGAFKDVPANNNAFSGADETCAASVHNYTLSANATITLACPDTSSTQQNQHLTYFFTQPASGGPFTYKFVAGNTGYSVIGDTPTACTPAGCTDYVTVDWVPQNNWYIVTLVRANIAGPSGGGGGGFTCPPGTTCYYVDNVIAGNSDSNDGKAQTTGGGHGPWTTIGRANEAISSLNPGDSILFKAGDTWLGTGGYHTSSPYNNHGFYFGDTTAHSLNATTAANINSSKSITIGSYGSGAKPKWDMQNLQPFCFATVNPSTLTMVGQGAVKYEIMSNIECERAYLAGVWIDPLDTSNPGMQVVGMNIHNVGAGYSTSTTSCNTTINLAGGNTEPPSWGGNGTVYPAQGPTASSLIQANGKGFYTASACTSGGSPTFPSSCTFGQTVSTGDSGCTWTCAGIAGLNYVNALQYLDTNHSPGGNSVTFKNNSVSCSGGHNLLEVEGDLGSPLISGNTIGPGGIHGGIDLKVSGDATVSPNKIASIVGNTVTCGAVAGYCGCAQPGGGSCATGQTPSLFTEDYILANHSNYIFQGNMVYDAYVGVQDIVGAPGNLGGQCDNIGGNHGDCPSNEKIYNNSIYLNPSSSTICVYAGGGNGNKGGSILDVRNNICDGTKQLFTVPVGNSSHDWASTIEDYNDLGGAQGFTNSYSFHGSSTPGSHDFCPSGCPRGSTTNPSYTNASATPPNLTLKSGSVCIGAGLSTLGTNNSNMGAF